MGIPLGRILSVVLLFQIWTITNGQDKKFPIMDDIFDNFYEAEVEVIDLIQNSTSYAKEYYNDAEDQGRVDFLTLGKKLSIFYFRDTGDILEINETACISNTIVNSSYSKIGVYYGWLTQSPFIIGPSALLWFVLNPKDSASKSITYENTTYVRGIKCDIYKVEVKNEREEMTYKYYFADPNWLSPNGKNGKRTPIRITVEGITSIYKAGSHIPIKQIVDFSYFRPMISDLEKLVPTIGLGCFGRESSRDLPNIPNEFMFYEEEFDLNYAENHENVDVNFNAIFFEGRRQLARIDTYRKTGMTSNLHDFNTGVTYYIENELTCQIKPLEHSFFENEGTIFQGNMKTAKEVMGLTGNFYFLGSRTYRGINVDVYEKAEFYSTYVSNENYLTVITVFFTSDTTDAVNNGADKINVPVYSLITMYDKPNNVIYRKQYNIFAFEDAVGPAIYENFPIKDCFPLSQQKSYFVLIMKDSPELGEMIAEHHNQFIAAIKSEITKTTNVSDLRIPFLKIDYLSKQIYAIGMLLDRPPVLKQFHETFTSSGIVAKKMKLIVDAKNTEQCAYACVDETKCGFFHFCGVKAPSQGVCFIDMEPMSTSTSDPTDFGNCYVYFRAEMNSNNKEPYLMDALERLSDAIYTDKEFKILVLLDNIANTWAELIVADIIIGEGPFDITPADKDYNVVIQGAQLIPASESHVILEKEYVGTELDCYKSCRLEASLDCESFSYCQQSEKKQCRISSEFLSRDMATLETITSNKDCNVYSLMYLDFFELNPGRILMRQGDSAFKNIKSVEECAMNCKKETELPCRGFDFCETKKTCILHSTHVTDLHPSEVTETKDETCVHYSAKFTADYLNLGHTIIVDNIDKKEGLTVEECARSCSEENPSCRNFIYCRGNGVDDSTCSLTRLDLTSEGAVTKNDENCYLYNKKDTIKDWHSKKASLTVFTGYTKSGFVGLVLGMIALGLFVGIIGFLAYSYYRSRRPTDGMTVRFMKQTND